jgi:hypothetical protein
MSYALQPSPIDKKYLLLKQKENQEKGHTSILRGRDVKFFSSPTSPKHIIPVPHLPKSGN